MESDSDRLGYEVWHDTVTNVVKFFPTEGIPSFQGEEGPYGVCVASFGEKYFNEAKAAYYALLLRLKGQPIEDKILVNEIVDKTYGVSHRTGRDMSDVDIKAIMIFILLVIFMSIGIMKMCGASS